MEELNTIFVYQNKKTKQMFLLKQQKGFVYTLTNMETGEEIRTTGKKIDSDYDILGTTIHQ